MGLLKWLSSVFGSEPGNTGTSTNRRYRTCDYCGKANLGPYTDPEWNARGRMCEECEYAEMADGTLW